MHNQQYTLDDLILDPAFIKWVKKPIQEDGRIWIEWASLSDANSNIIREAREIILELAKDNDTPLQQELADLWDRIVTTNDAFDLRQKRQIGLTAFLRSWQLVAAVITALLVVSSLAILSLDGENEFETSYGQNKNIQLPDGSIVVLNANSTVTYSSKWDKDQPREIWLKGEAFFSVKHTSNSQKFIVHTNDLDVQVLGTKFNVNTRRENTQVILNSGKVKLYLASAADRVVDMKPGEMVNFSKKAEHLEKQTVRASKYSAWVEKKLVFEDASMKEIAQVLEDTYGLKVKFLDPELLKLTFTGTIDSGNIDLLFTILQKTFNISIIKKEDTITIDSK